DATTLSLLFHALVDRFTHRRSSLIGQEAPPGETVAVSFQAGSPFGPYHGRPEAKQTPTTRHEV
ncbi:MAG TPA: hypothetical protein VES58_01965, partial [Syntrophobacteria bacterium]|nr:hypothetical protein [Syntrophobacteria bacterium]